MFGNTYMCERRFSTLKQVKFKTQIYWQMKHRTTLSPTCYP